jgi:hypothetical protein
VTETRGLGTAKCAGTFWLEGQAYPCTNLEVEGLEFCLPHMPDDLLEEAEEITGRKRCRTDECTDYAKPGSVPPMCEEHLPSVNQRDLAQRVSLRLVKGQAQDRARELIAENGSRLATADPVTDPYGELMAIAGELREWKNVLREEVEKLERLRYQGKAGEQTRGEAILYSNALNDVGALLTSIARLNLDQRLVGIRQQTADMLERQLDLAIEAAGVPLDKKQEAKKVFRQGLQIVS